MLYPWHYQKVTLGTFFSRGRDKKSCWFKLSLPRPFHKQIRGLWFYNWAKRPETPQFWYMLETLYYYAHRTYTYLSNKWWLWFYKFYSYATHPSSDKILVSAWSIWGSLHACLTGRPACRSRTWPGRAPADPWRSRPTKWKAAPRNRRTSLEKGCPRHGPGSRRRQQISCACVLVHQRTLKPQKDVTVYTKER